MLAWMLHVTWQGAVARWRRVRARFLAPVRLWDEQRSGWSGALPIYLFWCPGCRRFGQDYLHGWPGREYLQCAWCAGRR